MSDASKVIGADIVGRSTIEDWLARSPEIVGALERANARIVLVEMDRNVGAERLPDALQSALNAAESTVPANVACPVFVVLAYAFVLRDAGIVFTAEHRASPTPVVTRGAFAGYFAMGEGGAVFVAGGPDPHERPEQVLARLLG